MSALPGTLNAAAGLVGGTARAATSAAQDTVRTVLSAAESVIGGGRDPGNPAGLIGRGPDGPERLADGGLARNLANDGPGRGPPFVPPGHAAREASAHGGQGPAFTHPAQVGREPSLLAGLGGAAARTVDALLPRLVDTRQVAGAVVALAQQAPATLPGLVGALQRDLPPTDFRNLVQDAAGAVRAQVRGAGETLAAVRTEVVRLAGRPETTPSAVSLIARDVASTTWTRALAPGVPALVNVLREAGGLPPTIAVPHLAVAGKVERVEAWIGVLDRIAAQLAAAPTLRPLLAPALQQLLTTLRAAVLETLPAPLRLALIRLIAAAEAALGPRQTPVFAEAGRAAGLDAAAAEAARMERLPPLPAALGLLDGGVVRTDGAPDYVQVWGPEPQLFGAPADDGGAQPGPQSPIVDDQGFPIFDPLVEVYLEHAHVESASTDQRFAAANAELGQALRDSPSLQAHIGLTDAQAGFLQDQPQPWGEANPIAPPDLVWHHHQEPGRLQLVLRADHQAANPSLGGASVWGGLR